MFSLHYQDYFYKKLDLHIVKNENPQVFYQELEVITKSHSKEEKNSFLLSKTFIETTK